MSRPDAPRSTLDELTRGSAFERLWRGFMTARSTVALVLLAVLGALHALAPTLGVSEWLVGLAATYLIAAVTVQLASEPRGPGPEFDAQWVSTIGIDLIAFAALQYLAAAGLNYSPLFALPVLMAAVLGSTMLALGTAAGVALLLLSDAWVQALHVQVDVASRFLQAALTAAGYFALAFVVSLLAGRLAREEEAARVGHRAAREQAQVNELVIEVLTEGVIVVDGRAAVQAANPAARRLLGFDDAHDARPFSLEERAAWQPLAELALLTFSERRPQWAELALEEDGGAARRVHVHVRTRLTAAQEHRGEGICVMFLQDLREMEARLRTEKLAAMGRMSAAVAHEIRNPLAAIVQANDLMEEDLREPGLRQLTALVRKNTQRLQQIVEEILDVSRVRQNATAEMLQLDATVAAACKDWATQTRSAGRLQLALAAPSAAVRFEVDHLRRVLVNLLDNALRYAGEQPDSIRVLTRHTGGRASLHVWSDGAPLEPSVQRHLFEPFFSSESRSSGLGLYICRELCERHGATMAYERRPGGSAGDERDGNEFIVAFAPGASPVAGRTSFDRIIA